MSEPRLSPQKNSALKTLAEISRIVTSSHDTDETLLHTAQMIADRMDVEACSIYVYNEVLDFLVLRATVGLNPSTIGQIKMSPSEGLVGLVMQLNEPVQVADMKVHPRFKYFPQTDEDRYSSFLGVPLVQYRKPFGVLAVHTVECRNFTEEEEQILITIASQISGVVSKALLLEQLEDAPVREDPQHARGLRIKGNAVAMGIALGRAVLLEKNVMEEPERQTSSSVEAELETFQQALDRTIQDVLALIERISDSLSADEAAIFHAHLMFLEDNGFQSKIKNYIEEGGAAVWSIYQVIQEYLRAFAAIDDPYLREKGEDLKDVGYRLLNHLGHGQLASFEREGIVVTKQLLPSDVAHMDPNKIKGVVTSTGGAVSHAAILARSLLIPALCIDEEALEEIKEGDLLALDGQAGLVVINPSEEVLLKFQQLLKEHAQYINRLTQFNDRLCLTKDGVPITTLANIGLLSDLNSLGRYGAQGIGLYRTEMYFLSLDGYPSIEAQRSVYAQVIQSVQSHHPVIFRTLDIGADKAAPYMGMLAEENPFLGNRAIRHQMENPEILKNQIKAILLAAAGHANVQLLFPMISQMEEILFARQIYRECQQELKHQGVTPPDLPLGMMLEIPSAVLLCESFIHESDFFSIGSNDLTQYILAVDRNNSHIAHMYDPLHPSVLKLIQYVVEATEKHQKPLELCGEMASDPDGCVILVGLGLRQLSMNAALIPIVKERLAQITLPEAQILARQALQASSAQEVRASIHAFFQKPSLATEA